MDIRGDTGHEPGPAVSLVIVSHQTRDLLRACLRSIYEHPPSGAFEVCVLDNASTDGSGEMVRSEFPEVQLIENKDNVGYSRAVNLGARRTSAPYVLVINPDILVTEGSVEALVRFMDARPRVGVAGGKLLNPDGTLQYSARTFYTPRILLLRRTFLGRLFPNSRAIREHLMLDWDHGEACEVDWLIGACLMIRRAAAEDVGLMDERFFLYFEDVDLCYRMKQRGWGVVYVPEAVMVHHHRRQSARRVINRPLLWHLNSVFRFYEKWGGVSQAIKRHRRLVRMIAFLLSDIVSVNLAFFVAYLARFLLRPILVKPLFGVGLYLDLILFVNVTTLLAFATFGLYRSRAHSWVEESLAVTKAASVSFLILMAGTFLSQTQFYSRSLVAFFWPSVVVLASLGRVLLMRLHVELRGFQFDLRRVLVVGSGPRAEEIQRRVLEDPRLGCELVGVLADEKTAGLGVPVLGRPGDLPELVGRMNIHEVIFADPGVSCEDVGEFLLKSGTYGVDVRVMTGLTEVLTRTGRVEEFLGVPVAVFEKRPLFGVNAAVKRGLDVLGAVLGLGMLGLAAGPVGLARLVMGTGSAAGRCDGRVRKALSDLSHVLVGRTSFVGPRATSGAVLGREGQNGARPGLTGLWAGTGLTLLEEEKDLLDFFYLQNWSLGLDLRILLESLSRPRGRSRRAAGDGIRKGGD